MVVTKIYKDKILFIDETSRSRARDDSEEQTWSLEERIKTIETCGGTRMS